MKVERHKWLDVTRGVGIILVVVGHVLDGLVRAGVIQDDTAFSVVFRAIYSFHMPLFFVISGMVFDGALQRRGVFGSFANRLQTILYPLVLWSYIAVLVRLVAGDAANRGAPSFYEVLSYPFPPKDVYWFLGALFIIQTCLSVFLPLRQYRFVAYAAVGFTSMAALITFGVLPPPGWAYRSVEFAPYFILGIFLRYWMISFGSSAAALLGGAVLIAMQVAVAVQPTSLEAYQLPGWMVLLVGMTCSLSVVAIVAWIASRSAHWIVSGLASLGVASMAIFVSHVIFAAAFRTLLLRLGIENGSLHVLGGSLAGLALPYLMYAISVRLRINKWLGLGGRFDSEPRQSKQRAKAMP